MTDIDTLASDFAALTTAGRHWPNVPVAERVALLRATRKTVAAAADEWVAVAARAKSLAQTSPYLGEEWVSGPYALLSACDDLIATLQAPARFSAFDRTASGQLRLKMAPMGLRDRLFLPGIQGEVWFSRDTEQSATRYKVDPDRAGRVALILGAGNITSIAPLDAFHKLFHEDQVCLIKLNPVLGDLAPIFARAFQALIDADVMRIVTGGADLGQKLCDHTDIDEIHVTGSGATYDAIVWGQGEEADKNKAAGTPIRTKPVTAELGAVCPTIVVPGPWSEADLKFQGEHLATQKLFNGGFNCVSSQVVILPRDWSGRDPLLAATRRAASGIAPRAAYYPGTARRLDAWRGARQPQKSGALEIAAWCEGEEEVFGPALSLAEVNARDPEAFLEAAIGFANTKLYGSLGACILIHPATLRQIGRTRFETLLGQLHYGAISVNGWTGINFLLTRMPWGAYPGHSREDVQSGIGTVHNTAMLAGVEKTVTYAPFRPYPRSLFSRDPAFLPRPPWFVTNKTGTESFRLMTRLLIRPRLGTLLRLLVASLKG